MKRFPSACRRLRFVRLHAVTASQPMGTSSLGAHLEQPALWLSALQLAQILRRHDTEAAAAAAAASTSASTAPSLEEAARLARTLEAFKLQPLEAVAATGDAPRIELMELPPVALRRLLELARPDVPLDVPQSLVSYFLSTIIDEPRNESITTALNRSRVGVASRDDANVLRLAHRDLAAAVSDALRDSDDIRDAAALARHGAVVVAGTNAVLDRCCATQHALGPDWTTLLACVALLDLATTRPVEVRPEHALWLVKRVHEAAALSSLSASALCTLVHAAAKLLVVADAASAATPSTGSVVRSLLQRLLQPRAANSDAASAAAARDVRHAAVDLWLAENVAAALDTALLARMLKQILRSATLVLADAAPTLVHPSDAVRVVHAVRLLRSRVHASAAFANVVRAAPANDVVAPVPAHVDMQADGDAKRDAAGAAVAGQQQQRRSLAKGNGAAPVSQILLRGVLLPVLRRAVPDRGKATRPLGWTVEELAGVTRVATHLDDALASESGVLSALADALTRGATATEASPIAAVRALAVGVRCGSPSLAAQSLAVAQAGLGQLILLPATDDGDAAASRLSVNAASEGSVAEVCAALSDALRSPLHHNAGPVREALAAFHRDLAEAARDLSDHIGVERAALVAFHLARHAAWGTDDATAAATLDVAVRAATNAVDDEAPFPVVLKLFYAVAEASAALRYSGGGSAGSSAGNVDVRDALQALQASVLALLRAGRRMSRAEARCLRAALQSTK